MITGAHVVLHSRNAEADRAFLRDGLGLEFIDAGEGWLLFALPPTELAFHPADDNGVHELFLMCADLQAETAALTRKNVRYSQVQEAAWGSIVTIPLPGGGSVRLYQPKHATVVKLGTS